MNTYILLGLLASLTVQAAPAKRRCYRHPATSNSTGNAESYLPTHSADISEAQTTSLSAVGAWAQGSSHGSRGGWRSHTARPPRPTGDTASVDPIGTPSSAPAPSASDARPADPSASPSSSPAPSTSDTQPAPSSDLPAPSSDPVEPADDATPTTTIINNNNVAVPSVTSQTGSFTPSSAESAAAPAPTSSGNSAGSKRAGLAINEQSVKDFSGFLDGNVGWYTGWAMTPLTGTDGLEWVPQVWGSGNAAEVKAKAADWPEGVTHVLSFNEPDMTSTVGGSDITAAVAAQKHIEWVNNLGGDYKIGSPAVARGSTKWMDDWVAACDGKCKYDFVAFHYYGTDANDLISYAKDFYARYKKPLWLTETACHDYSANRICTEDQVKTFMKTAVDWFEGEGSSMVERWAWFGAFPDSAAGGNPNGLENTDGTPNAMGEYYLSL